MQAYRFSGTPRGIARCLGTVIALLLCANAIGLIMRFGLGHNSVYGLVPLFDVDIENNIPSFFSVCMGLCGAALFAVIAFNAKHQGNRDAVYWFALAAGFLFIAYDEGFQVHEKMIHPMRRLMGGSDPTNGAYLGFFFHGWVVPGLICVALIALCFVKFLLRLPIATRRRLLTAAALFLGGCLGMELINGKVVEVEGRHLLYFLLVMTEEGLEMAGLATLIYALTSHIAEGCDKLEVDLHASETAPAPAVQVARPTFG